MYAYSQVKELCFRVKRDKGFTDTGGVIQYPFIAIAIALKDLDSSSQAKAKT